MHTLMWTASLAAWQTAPLSCLLDIGLPPFLELFQCHLIPVNKPLRGLIHRLFELRLPHLDTEFEHEVEAKLGELLGFIQRTAAIEI